MIPLLQTLPVTWDETLVLEGSGIGTMAAFAKRKGKEWYVAVINGTDQPQEFVLSPSFLPRRGRFKALVVSDRPGDAGFAVKEETIKHADNKKLTIPATGGIVIRIKR